jgi:hypothetical protein
VTISTPQTVMFTVTATGYTEPLFYQWRFEPATSQGFNDIPGATGNILAIDNANSSNAGRYRCFIFNECGVKASRVARLTVL